MKGRRSACKAVVEGVGVYCCIVETQHGSPSGPIKSCLAASVRAINCKQKGTIHACAAHTHHFYCPCFHLLAAAAMVVAPLHTHRMRRQWVCPAAGVDSDTAMPPKIVQKLPKDSHMQWKIELKSAISNSLIYTGLNVKVNERNSCFYYLFN